MRHFTKTHNDLKWLFPIAKTKKEASKIFDYVEETAKSRCDAAAIPEKDQDLAIDAYMKGYSDALQLEIPQMQDKLFRAIYCNLFKVEPDTENETKWKKFFRFCKIEDLLKQFAFRGSRATEKTRKYVCKLFEGTAFDMDAPTKEHLKIDL